MVKKKTARKEGQATGTAVARTKTSNRGSSIDEKFLNSTEKLARATSRKEALSQIPDSVKAIAEEMIELASNAERDSVMVAWQEGKLVYTLLNDPDRTINAVVATVAGLLDVSWRSLYDFAKIYELWPEEEKMRKLVSSQCANGKILGVSHFCAVARLGRRQDAEALLKKARSENLSVRDIADVVSDKKRGSYNPRGRTPDVPASFLDGFKCMSRSLNSFINYQEAHGKTVLEDLKAKFSENSIEVKERELIETYRNTLVDAYNQILALIEPLDEMIIKLDPDAFADPDNDQTSGQTGFSEKEEAGDQLFKDADDSDESSEDPSGDAENSSGDAEEVVEEDTDDANQVPSKGKGRRRRKVG